MSEQNMKNEFGEEREKEFITRSGTQKMIPMKKPLKTSEMLELKDGKYDEKQEENENENERVRTQIKNALYEIGVGTSAHGLPNLVRNQNLFLKILWTICLLGATSYCAYSIYQSIEAYFEYDVVTQIQTFYENPTLFPAVTICNANFATSYSGITFVNNVLLANNVSNIVTTNKFVTYPLFQIGANIYMARNLLSSNIISLNSTAQQTLSNGWYSMFTVCLYGSNGCDYWSSFKNYFHPQYGNCYQFNMGQDALGDTIDLQTSSKTGSRYGLNLLLFTGYPYSMNTLSIDNGAKIFIHNQTVRPTYTDGVSVSNGKDTSIVISKKFVQNLPLPYNDCYDDLTNPDAFDSFFYKQTLASGYTYTQKDCINLCVQDYLIKSCGCADPSYPTLYNASYCITISGTLCIFEAFLTLYETDANAQFTSYCPLECSTEEFEMTISSSDFPSTEMQDALLMNSITLNNLAINGLNATRDTIKSSVLWLNVYFDDFRYTLISESPKQTAFDLLAVIGGTLGLYIGVSFLSIVEFIEAIIQVTFILAKNYLIKKRVVHDFN